MAAGLRTGVVDGGKLGRGGVAPSQTKVEDGLGYPIVCGPCFTPPPMLINHSEQFEYLPRAPIVEAVIEFRARAEAGWDLGNIPVHLESSLHDYPKQRSLLQGSITAQFRATPDAHPETQVEHGWVGVQAESADGRHVAKFTRDAFSLSRLAPYEDWDRFKAEAFRLWDVHCSLAKPLDVQRIGVRFINRLEAPKGPDFSFSDYFVGLGEPPSGLPMAGFLYRDSLGVPGHPYFVTVIRTFQQPEQENPATIALLLDIDAYCPEPSSVEASILEQRLADLHWLKNRVFFGSLTEKALGLCR